MGNFSRDTYDRIKHYVGVRLQQGVPLVDADWNEQEDIKKFELQAFLKWYVGSGVPQGNDGFRIRRAFGTTNDFIIDGGDGTPSGAGHCLVEGWDVMNESDILYSSQDSVPALTTPTADRTDTVYLDVWEREVDSAEDTDLVNPAIGLETCVRLKREWRVRVAEDANAPPAAPPGHVFYVLATLNRPAGVDFITSSHITDRRRTGLTIANWNDTRQITRDAFGDSYGLDGDGEPNLKVSLRDAINGLLQGGIPMTPQARVSADAGIDVEPSIVRDADGDIWVFWRSNRTGTNAIWCNRYFAVDEEWEGETLVSTDSGNESRPRAVVDGNGDVWVFWQSIRDGNYDVWHNRFGRANGAWRGEEQLTTDTAHEYHVSPIVDSNGDIWVFWQSARGGDYNIWYDFFQLGSGGWDGNTQLTSDAASDFSPHAVVDAGGDIWVFWRSTRGGNTDIYYRRRQSGTWDSADTRRTFDTGTDTNPYAVVDGEGDVWLFWEAYRGGAADIWYQRFNSTLGWSSEAQITTSTATDTLPMAIVDGKGDVWLFWNSSRAGNYDVWYNRFSHAAGWSGDRPITSDQNMDFEAQAAVDADGDIWVAWRLISGGDYDIWYRKLIPSI